MCGIAGLIYKNGSTSIGDDMARMLHQQRLGGTADQRFVVQVSNDRGDQAVTALIAQYLDAVRVVSRIAGMHDGNDGIGRAKIDADSNTPMDGMWFGRFARFVDLQ